MAETLLGVVAETVLSKAFSLAAERISGAWGVKEDLRSLAEQLEMIQALLSDAESKSTTGTTVERRAVELWLKKLEDAATEADCLLDEFAYEVLRKKIEDRKLHDKVRNFFSHSNPLAFRFKMASKIKKINLRINGIFEESVKIGLVSRSDEIMNSSIDIRRDRITCPFVDNSEIIGRNNDVDKVVSALTSPEHEKDLSVIGIVGMGGQGKTTLAQLVYKKEEVTRYFEKKIWVCVSDDFCVEKILNDMLQSLTGTISELTKREVIVNQLNEKLNGKKLLLVLDDVWNEDAEHWSCMKKCLQEIGGLQGSKIIVTTRSERVASIMRAFLIHWLGALSTEESWKLFEKIAFVDGGAVKTHELVTIGERIVRKCGGLPLAIKAIGGVMNSKKDASEWSKIEESNFLGSLDASDRVLSVIKLSYDHLPSLSLKQCFAYCAVFQKDSIIKRKPLIQQWMAHGLLNPSRRSKLDMEDVGSNYFNILLQRSLFQEAKTDEFGNIESCKMHDLVHDFALEAAKDRCLTIDGGLQSEDIRVVDLSINAQRSESLDISTKNFLRLRTLFLSGVGISSLDVLAKCKYLCIFVVDSWDVTELPNSIVKLKHLKYLDISGTPISTLPNSITKLYNLQTLRLHGLQELPKDFENLVKLRHFYIMNFDNSVRISGIKKLSSLQTLPYFVVSGDRRCQIEELQCMQNLEGTLKIFGLENVINHEDAMKANISSKRNIVNLELHWAADIGRECNHVDVLEGLKPPSNLKDLKIVNFAGESLPSWLMNTSHLLLLQNLVSIRLEGLKRCQQIPMLGHLPFLKVVDIQGMESVKCFDNQFYGWTNQSELATSSVAVFPSLKEFSLWNMLSLEQWSDLTAHPSYDLVQIFPLLEKLDVYRAPKLTRLPDILNRMSSLKVLGIENSGLSHLPEDLGGLVSLEKLKIYDCSGLVSVSCIRELRSLRELTIGHCYKLGSLPNELETFAKLEELAIYYCSCSILFENLRCPTNLRDLRLFLTEEIDYEDFPWPRKCTSLPFLETLALGGTSKIKSLPEQIQHLPALRDLRISEFQIEALPQWLCDMPSLRILYLFKFRNLAYLPSREALQRLTCSCDLQFHDCPILKERCTEGSSREWDKIANLRNIRFIY